MIPTPQRLMPRGRLTALLSATLLLASLLPLASVATVLGAAATKLVFNPAAGSPQVAGVPFNVIVEARDGSNAVDTGFTGVVTFASSDPQATVSPASPYQYLGGDNGVHTFSVTLKTAGSRTITFSSSSGLGLTSAIATITVDPGAANKLAFTQQPSTSAANVAFTSQPKVAVQDSLGNTITADSATAVTLVEVRPGSSTGAVSCTTNPQTVVNGIATFSGCRITGGGAPTGIGYKLRATGGGLTLADSGAFDIADNLSFATQPGGGAGSGSKAQGGIAFTNQPRILVRAVAATAVNDSTTIVTLSIKAGTGAAGAALTCDQAANQLKATAGSSQFSGCRIDKAGTGYQLIATSAPTFGSTVWTSTAFDVVAGPATTLTFVTQPAGAAAGQAFTTQPVVAITDAGGNVATVGVSAIITLSIGTNPGVPAGVLSCTPGVSLATATSGVNAGKAVFAGCKISNAGVGYTLIAVATSISGAASLAPATSTAFTVTAPAAQIALTPSVSVITWGTGVTLSTHFAVNGAGKTFTLQGTRDSITWVTIATLTTNSAGDASYAYRPSTSLNYQAVFAGTSDLVAGTSPIARVAVRQKESMSPTNHGATRIVTRGSRTTFTATVRPFGATLPASKVTFSFYRLKSGHWVFATKRDVMTNAAGRAVLVWTWSSRGEWYVRSVANATLYNAHSATSPKERYSVR